MLTRSRAALAGRRKWIMVVLKKILTFPHRTGTVWSYQHLGLVPDILVCSKPLSAGVPFAVVATRPELAQSLNQVGKLFALGFCSINDDDDDSQMIFNACRVFSFIFIMFC